MAQTDLMKSVLGFTALELVERLPAMLPEIVRFTFAQYEPAPGVDQRIRATSGTAIHAELERLKSSVPELFERVVGLSALMSSVGRDPEKTIAQMMRHDNSDESAREFTLDSTDIARSGAAGAVGRLHPGNVLALVSRCVSDDGATMHLPILDFHVAPSAGNQHLVERAARHLGLPHAAILVSGRSYHLYGVCALTGDEWVRFMVRSLLLAPLVDSRYVAHRLLADRGVLRITAISSKPVIPCVVSAY